MLYLFRQGWSGSWQGSHAADGVERDFLNLRMLLLSRMLSKSLYACSLLTESCEGSQKKTEAAVAMANGAQLAKRPVFGPIRIPGGVKTCSLLALDWSSRIGRMQTMSHFPGPSVFTDAGVWH